MGACHVQQYTQPSGEGAPDKALQEQSRHQALRLLPRHNVSEAAFKTWLKKYGAEGLSGLYRSKKTPSPASRGRGRDGGDPAPRAHQDQNRAGATKKRLHPDPERRWDAGRVRACIREECAIIEALSKEFPVTGLCSLCGVSRSGFYKWRKRGGDPPKDRAKVLRLVQGCHDATPRTGTGGCTPTSRGAMA